MSTQFRKKQSRRYSINRLKMIKRKAKMKVMYKRMQSAESRKKLAGNLTQKTTLPNADE